MGNRTRNDRIQDPNFTATPYSTISSFRKSLLKAIRDVRIEEDTYKCDNMLRGVPAQTWQTLSYCRMLIRMMDGNMEREKMSELFVQSILDNVEDDEHIIVYSNNSAANRWEKALLGTVPAVILPYPKTIITLPYMGVGRKEIIVGEKYSREYPTFETIGKITEKAARVAILNCFEEDNPEVLFWLDPFCTNPARIEDSEAYLGEYVVHYRKEKTPQNEALR